MKLRPTEQFRGARIHLCDLSGLEIRDCDVTTMRRVVDELTEAELDRVCGRKPADHYPDKDYVVRRCLSVVLKEEAEHHRYAVRDLTVLEADARTE
jgi:hypothetical protein